MKNLSYLLVFFLLGMFCSKSQEPTPKNEGILGFSIYKTEKHHLGLKELLETNPVFTQNQAYKEPFDYSKTYWLKVDLAEMLDSVDFNESWRLRPNIIFENATGYFRYGKSIDSISFGYFDSKAPWHSIYTFPGLPFSKETLLHEDVYIKFRCYLHEFSFEKLQIKFLSEYKANELIKTNSGRYNNRKGLDYFFAGICFILSVCFLFVYLNTKRREYLFYSLYLICCFFYLTAQTVLFKSIKPLGYGNFFYWLGTISQVFINLFYCLFVLYYLETKKNYPKLHNIIKGVLICIGLVIILDIVSVLVPYYRLHFRLLDSQRILMTLFGLYGMIYLLSKSKSRLAYFIVGGSFSYMVGALGFLFYGQKNYMIIGTILEITVFTLGIAYKIQQQNKEKIVLQKEVSEKEISALRAQMNPHFIFNSLNSIQHLILVGDKLSAMKYLTKFSRLARKVLDNSTENKVSLADEIGVLDAYLELESLRFDNAFEYNIEVDDRIDCNTMELPLLLVQPFVENSIIHGLLPKKLGNKRLFVRFKLNENDLICEVEDNGIGRLASQTLQNATGRAKKSKGMKITERRLELITSFDQKNTDIHIQDKYDLKGNPSGTKIIIKIFAA